MTVRRSHLRPRILAAGIPLLLAAALAGCGGSGATTEPPEVTAIPDRQTTDLEEAVELAGCELDSPKNEGSGHTEERVTYEANPATSGDHFPVPAEDGFLVAEAPPVEPSIHALEHGRINIQWAAGSPPETISGLQALFDEDPYHLLGYENQTEMPAAVAATAWDQSLTCAEMTPEVYDALRAFRDTYRDQGPEFVP